MKRKKNTILKVIPVKITNRQGSSQLQQFPAHHEDKEEDNSRHWQSSKCKKIKYSK